MRPAQLLGHRMIVMLLRGGWSREREQQGQNAVDWRASPGSEAEDYFGGRQAPTFARRAARITRSWLSSAARWALLKIG